MPDVPPTNEELNQEPTDIEKARKWRREIESRIIEVETRIGRLEAQLELRRLGEDLGSET